MIGAHILPSGQQDHLEQAIGKGVINSGDIHDHTIQASDISAKLRTSLKGQTGPQGPKGDAGAQGAPGTALAYAHVDGATAGVDESRSFNVSDSEVSHGVSTGSYCVNVPFTVHNAVANVDLAAQDTAFATVAVGTDTGNCPAGADVSLSIHLGGATASPENDSFFIVLN
jgi:hypothetical protein